MSDQKPVDETQRLRTLRGLGILDTDREAGFEILARAAQQAAGTEMALVSLVDEERQWFKATIGFDGEQTPREHAFCAHAILGSETFCVDDATLDDRFCDNPLVTVEGGFRAYAGAPVIVDGHAVGTVCAISTRPRVFSNQVRQDLKRIAAAAAERMAIGRQLQIQTKLFQSSGDAVVMADADGRITFWNKAAETIFGYSQKEAAGLTVADLAPLRLRPQHLAGMARVGAGGPSTFEGKPVELAGLHRDGHEVPVEMTLSLWSQGSERGYGAFLRDCRERRALEEARAFSESSDRFLANMSHEIRTPLNGLLGLAQALEQTSLDGRQTEMVRLMIRSGEALQRVLSDVLQSARMREKGPEIVEEAFDLTALLKDVFNLHAPSARSKGLAYRSHIPKGDTWVMSDPTRLAQILSNLLTNAIKFTAVGSVRLRAARTPAGGWRIEVHDTGIGFSGASTTQIFERFTQEDNSITRRFGGSGLGLSIARDLARALGGDIEAAPAADHGAIFTVALPLAAAARPARAACPQRISAEKGPTRILLAEDHAVNRKVIALLLESMNAELTTVENGALALEVFEREPFDVVLMDMHMPVMDGLTAIAEIRKSERRRGALPARIVTLTANAFAEHKRAALSVGADMHLTKPIVASKLFEALFGAPADGSQRGLPENRGRSRGSRGRRHGEP